MSARFLATATPTAMILPFARTLLATVGFLVTTTVHAALDTPDALSDSASSMPSAAVVSLMDEVDTGISLLPVSPDTVWLHIDLRSRQLDVVRGQEVIETIPHFSIGVNGADNLRVRGSAITPTGQFRIERINPYSQFHTFLGINYPNPTVAKQALDQGLISEEEAQRIRRYYDRHRLSYPNTTLGGHIGIHGLGQRDPFLHQRTDWTEGCVAVENEQIRSLSRLVGVDTPVLIQ